MATDFRQLARARVNRNRRRWILSGLGLCVGSAAFLCAIGVIRSSQWRHAARVVVGSSQQSTGVDSPAPPQIPDLSLSNERYLALGIPSQDRAWNADEFAAASSKLQELAAHHPEQLPRCESAKSGQTFARIVSSENRGRLLSASLPLDKRLAEARGRVSSFNKIVGLYVSACKANNVAGNDVAELMTAGPDIVQVTLHLVNEFQSFSTLDPKYAAGVNALATVRQDCTSLVMSMLDALTLQPQLSVATRLKLAESYRAAMPAVVGNLSAASRLDVLRRLDALAVDPKLRELQMPLLILRNASYAAADHAAESDIELKFEPSPETTVITDRIPLWRNRGGLFVSVVLNGSHKHLMCVDTGCDLVSLPYKVAVDCGVELDRAKNVRLQLANGSIVKGKVAILDSVRVGQFTLRHVLCSVAPPSQIRAPLLLGRAFLGRFKFELTDTEMKLSKLDAERTRPTPDSQTAKPEGAKSSTGAR